MYIDTPSHDWRQALGANSTSTAYSTTYELTSSPFGSTGVWPVNKANQVLVKPHGVGSDNNTGGLRVSGIRRINNTAGSTAYEVTPLAQFALTLCTATGAASGVIGTSQRWADTLTAEHGPSNLQVSSGTSNIPGHALVDCEGFEWVKFEPIVTTATSMNVIFSFI